MIIAISGATGFIGKQLSDYFLRTGNELIMISRGDFACGINHLAKVINSADVIINLAGSSVLLRWTNKNRDIIRSSRIITTQLLVDAVRKNETGHCPKVFINASAIGIYGDSGNHDEYSTILGSGFLASVCKAWESETVALNNINLRLCIIRIGIVLGNTGGTFGKMLPVFKAGLGGRIGSGKQPFSFIHILDFCRAIEHLILNDKSSGVYNLASPEPTTNNLFSKTLSRYLHRPYLFIIPGFVLKIIYGEASVLLTEGICVKPTRLAEEGFKFLFPDVSAAVYDLVKSPRKS
jgi:uncharacterized protein